MIRDSTVKANQSEWMLQVTQSSQMNKGTTQSSTG